MLEGVQLTQASMVLVMIDTDFLCISVGFAQVFIEPPLFCNQSAGLCIQRLTFGRVGKDFAIYSWSLE